MKKTIGDEDMDNISNKRAIALFDFSEKFKFRNEFTNYQKIEKFDSMCEEYERLMNYRQMLYVMITQSSVSSEFNDDGVIVQKTRRLSAYDISSVHNEIGSLNTIISWIETFILDEPNLTKKIEEFEEEESNVQQKNSKIS